MSAQLKLRGYQVGRRKASRYIHEMDITFIPMKHGFLYLTAIIDWYSRCIVMILWIPPWSSMPVKKPLK